MEQQLRWLGPLYLVHHGLIGLTLALVFGWPALMYAVPVAIGLQPFGRLADHLVHSEESDDSRAVRERMVNYFD